jgi:hypothetical protein
MQVLLATTSMPCTLLTFCVRMFARGTFVIVTLCSWYAIRVEDFADRASLAQQEAACCKHSERRGRPEPICLPNAPPASCSRPGCEGQWLHCDRVLCYRVDADHHGAQTLEFASMHIERDHIHDARAIHVVPAHREGREKPHRTEWLLQGACSWKASVAWIGRCRLQTHPANPRNEQRLATIANATLRTAGKSCGLSMEPCIVGKTEWPE